MEIDAKIKQLLKPFIDRKITVLMCYGITGKDILYTIDILTEDFKHFNEPTTAPTFETAVEYAILECERLGLWTK